MPPPSFVFPLEIRVCSLGSSATRYAAQPRLASSSPSSCLSLEGAGTVGSPQLFYSYETSIPKGWEVTFQVCLPFLERIKVPLTLRLSLCLINGNRAGFTSVTGYFTHNSWQNPGCFRVKCFSVASSAASGPDHLNSFISKTTFERMSEPPDFSI